MPCHQCRPAPLRPAVARAHPAHLARLLPPHPPQMLKHGRAGIPLEVMGLMLGEFVDDYTVRVIDVFAMPQNGTVRALVAPAATAQATALRRLVPGFALLPPDAVLSLFLPSSFRSTRASLSRPWTPCFRPRCWTC